MNRIIFSFLIIFISINTNSQSIICNDAANRVYLGIENAISIGAEGVRSDKLILKTDNGKLLATANGYVWVPEHLGAGTLTLYKLNKKDTSFYGSKMFHVISIPLKLILYGSQNDSISIKGVNEVKRVFLHFDLGGCIYGIDNKASQFSVIAKRGDEILFFKVNIGMDFSDEIKELFKTLKKDDILLLFDFKLYEIFKDYKLSAYQFVITE